AARVRGGQAEVLRARTYRRVGAHAGRQVGRSEQRSRRRSLHRPADDCLLGRARFLAEPESEFTAESAENAETFKISSLRSLRSFGVVGLDPDSYSLLSSSRRFSSSPRRADKAATSFCSDANGEMLSSTARTRSSTRFCHSSKVRCDSPRNSLNALRPSLDG